MRITRRLEIDAGHRLLRHESKCANVHGHRYVFEVTVEADQLDDVGRVVDFGVVRDLVGGWLDEHWDHAFIYQDGDPIGDWLAEHAQRRYSTNWPPTAENMAMHVHDVARVLLADRGLRVVNVRVHETPNCFADSRSFVVWSHDKP